MEDSADVTPPQQVSENGKPSAPVAEETPRESSLNTITAIKTALETHGSDFEKLYTILGPLFKKLDAKQALLDSAKSVDESNPVSSGDDLFPNVGNDADLIGWLARNIREGRADLEKGTLPPEKKRLATIVEFYELVQDAKTNGEKQQVAALMAKEAIRQKGLPASR